MSNAEYLNRYLSREGTDIKKKKRLKKSTKSGGMRIIDDDIDLSSIPIAEVKIVPEDEEDKPVIVVEDRELINELWTSTKFTSNNWNGGIQIKTEFDADNIKIENESPPTLDKECDADFFESTKKLPKRRRNTDSDASPPRPREKSRNDSIEKRTASKFEKKIKRHNSDISPPRKIRKASPDLSPPRPTFKNKNNKRNRYAERISDESPPRRTKPESSRRKRMSVTSQQKDSSDISPPRKKHQNQSDSGLRMKSEPKSPQSIRPKKSGQKSSARLRRHDSGSDVSPPRGRAASNLPINDSASCSSAPRGRKRHDSTSSVELEREISPEVSQIEVIYRDKQGKKRNFEEEKAKKEEEEAKKKVTRDKYKEWAGGIKQKEMRQDYVEDALKEMSKPMARYADDVDLNEEQRNILRDGDPMLEYMRKKKAKEKSKDGKERPIYKGPEPPPNRFALIPGYRWDGVDRSNGFEKQLFAKQNDRKAVKELAYKWSVADM